MMPQIDRALERELARPHKLEEHRRKGAALGIGPEDHARLTHLFLKAGVGPAAFRGLTGDALATRILEHWRELTGAAAADAANA